MIIINMIYIPYSVSNPFSVKKSAPELQSLMCTLYVRAAEGTVEVLKFSLLSCRQLHKPTVGRDISRVQETIM